MPLPAGTGLDRRVVPAAQRRASRCRSTAPASVAPRAARGGRRDGRRGRPAARARLDLPVAAASTGSASSRPYEDSRYLSLRPTLKVTGGTPFAEDPRLVWHPAAAGAAPTLHAAGQGQRHAGDGLHEPEPVALHLAPLLGGRLARRPARAPAGSAAGSTVVGEPNNAIQGLSPREPSSPPRWPPRASRSPPPSSPPDYRFDSPGVWDDARRSARCSTASAASARCPSSNPILGQARQAQANAAILREPARDAARRHAAPVAYPEQRRRPAG